MKTIDTTPIEWFYEQIKFTNKDTYNELYEQYQQALKMEIEQIENVYEDGYKEGFYKARKYYTKNFKTNEI